MRKTVESEANAWIMETSEDWKPFDSPDILLSTDLLSLRAFFFFFSGLSNLYFKLVFYWQLNQPPLKQLNCTWAIKPYYTAAHMVRLTPTQHPNVTFVGKMRCNEVQMLHMKYYAMRVMIPPSPEGCHAFQLSPKGGIILVHIISHL